MRIVVGADDEGPVVETVVDELRSRGHEVTVFEREEWPRVAARVARAVAAGEADQGMLFCWTGTGTSMAANKVPGARAALAWEPWIAEGARKWNDANVLVMSLKRTEPETARAIVDAWLSVEEPDPDDRETVVTMSLSDRGDSTGVVVVQAGFATEARRALHVDGWTDCLDRLQELMSSRGSAEG